MATLDGAILRIMSDKKMRSAKEIRQDILDRSHLYEGDIPKSTLWYHLLMLCRRHKIRRTYQPVYSKLVYYEIV